MPGSSSAVACQAATTAVVGVQGLVHQRALEVTRQAGVPAQLEGGEQGQLVAEGLGDAGQVHRQQAVAARVGGVGHGAEDLPAAVEGGPGHGHLLSWVSAEAVCLAVHIPLVRTQSM